VTSDTGAFDSGSLAPGAKFSFTFQTRGSFPYHCTPHPGMVATVVVQ
jgi:plastocyanin